MQLHFRGSGGVSHRRTATRVLFDAVAPERIAAGLRAEPCVVVDDERSWTWLESPEPPARVLATIRIEGRRLVAEAFSEERANLVRGFLERRLGDAVRYRITELTDPMQALREHGARKEPGEERAPDRDLPDEVRALAAAQIVQHYEEWVDAALPALDGRTPRQAARLSSLRPQLIALLRDMDVSSERARGSGDVVNAVDFTPVWETLGLMEQRRPGSTVSAARPAAPAAGIPDEPNASDFADLEALLDQRLAWSNGMDIAMFDGLLCAIASSPESVPQAEGLPIVVGGEPTMFDEASSHQRLLSLLSKHADDVGRNLRAGTYAPIFWPKAPEGMPSVASPWCSGYSRGIALREKAWAPMFKDEHMRSLLIPILGLAIPLHSKDPAPPAKRDRKVLERSIPACANMIFSYWHEGLRPSADRSPAPEATVHRLKIALLGVKPQVWRRVELASGAKLPTVSRVLLAAMGWLDYHLHEFVVGGTHIGTESRDFHAGCSASAIGRSTKSRRAPATVSTSSTTSVTAGAIA